MPIPTVVCGVCFCTVSKRSTLSLRELGGGDGRACRSHTEVATLVDAAEKKHFDQKQWRNASERLAIIIAASEVRALCTIHGISPEIVYQEFKRAGINEGHLKKIREEVDLLGGPAMSLAEQLAITLDAMDMATRYPQILART